MTDVEHDVVGAPVFDERLQLILQILDLLASEPRNGVITAKPLRRDAVADFAISKFSLNVLRRDGLRRGGSVLGMTCPRHKET